MKLNPDNNSRYNNVIDQREADEAFDLQIEQVELETQRLIREYCTKRGLFIDPISVSYDRMEESSLWFLILIPLIHYRGYYSISKHPEDLIESPADELADMVCDELEDLSNEELIGETEE